MSHEHHLQYLLKTDNEGHFIGRVLQIPDVVAQGTSPEMVDEKIGKAALVYLQAYEEEHRRVMADTSSKLTDSGKGTIVGTRNIRVYC